MNNLDPSRYERIFITINEDGPLCKTMGKAAYAAYIGEFTPDHRIRKILEGI